MGFLNIFSKSSDVPAAGITRLPSGSFTVDRTGRLLSSTVTRSFSEAQVKEIADMILKMFISAQEANLPLKEIFVNYAGLKLTARELRGGAIVFLSPRSFDRS